MGRRVSQARYGRRLQNPELRRILEASGSILYLNVINRLTGLRLFICFSTLWGMQSGQMFTRIRKSDGNTRHTKSRAHVRILPSCGRLFSLPERNGAVLPGQPQLPLHHEHAVTTGRVQLPATPSERHVSRSRSSAVVQRSASANHKQTCPKTKLRVSGQPTIQALWFVWRSSP